MGEFVVALTGGGGWGFLATARVLWRLRKSQSVERAQAPACILANSTRKSCAIPGSGIYTGTVLVFFLKKKKYLVFVVK